MFPHYFITKGTGTNRTSMLSNYVDRIKEESVESVGRISKTNTLQ